MNELALKYGCNPNQKPSRIYMEDGSDLPVTVSERQARLHQFSGCPQLHPAGQGAESRLRPARGGLASSMFPRRARPWACP